MSFVSMDRKPNVCYTICLIFYYCLEAFVLVFVPKKLRYKSMFNETVLITGGGCGLGRALALRFAKLGANVVIWDIDESALKQTVKSVKKQFDILIKAYICDITDSQLVYETAEKVRQEVGNVTILINNAGILYGKSLLELSDEQIMNTLKVNTISNFWTLKAFLPNMLTENKGHIVTIASICGRTGFERMTDYCASKHAVLGFAESLGIELSRRESNQIKTTVVCPTFFSTDLITGVKPAGAIAVLEKNTVADRIIDGILTDEEVIIIPKYFNILFFIKSIIPVKAYNKLYELLGGYQVMKNFSGK